MSLQKNPFISRVQIKNFRNFLDVNVALNHKQVFIGENNVGKTNFLRALQLILDKDFSDNDRQLTSEDFHDSLENPMENGHEVLIVIDIQGYEHNSKLVAQFADAVISTSPPTLQFTYRYSPNKNEFGEIINYKYEIYQGNIPERKFTSEHRNFINIFVIRALRDVERELKAHRHSPLYKLVKQYDISEDDLETISADLKDAAAGIFELDEIVHIKETIGARFATLSGLQTDTDITLRTFDIDTERLLYSLQAYMGIKERPVSELSLGLANILYVSLMLLLLKDKTVMPLLKREFYDKLLEADKDGLHLRLYQETEKGNYLLSRDLSSNDHDKLYAFMDEHNYRPQSFTILAVEEPEAHLHPVLQRLIYREVLHNSNTSVIFTSHSTYITSVTPLRSIVHVRKKGEGSQAFSTVNLKLAEKEVKDIERYIDAKRGEIYFGKGVILVEGITEEYVVPAAANLLSKTLDEYGIVVSNIDSTNFTPYVRVLNALQIPWVLFTDGDYYEVETRADASGKQVKEKKFHVMAGDGEGFYRGNENIMAMLVALGIIKSEDIPEDINEEDELFRQHGAYIGKYTLEVDMMETSDEAGKKTLKSVFQELKTGGEVMQKNFDAAIDSGNYWLALDKIEGNISKGRFAQRLSSKLTPDLIPPYVEDGINYIVQRVTESYE